MATQEHKRTVELGPLFTSGAILLAYGLLRRRKLAVTAGLGAILLDRLPPGRALMERFRILSMQIVQDEPDQAEHPSGRAT